MDLRTVTSGHGVGELMGMNQLGTTQTCRTRALMNRSGTVQTCRTPVGTTQGGTGTRWGRPIRRFRLLTPVVAAAVFGCGTPDAGPRPESEAAPGTASVVFTISEPDLLPESVAFDPQTGSYFVGSTRKGKILRVVEGSVTEFKGPREDGLWMVIGMKVDPARRVLWVCSSQGGNLEGSTATEGRAAGLFRFDIDSGALLDRWVLDDGREHFLNDLALTSSGSAYVTHMFDDASIWVAEPDGPFEPFVDLAPESFPNGITLSGDESFLFIATSAGITRLNVGDRTTVLIYGGDPDGGRGIDGLYVVDGGLVGVKQEPGSVVRYDLDEANRAITLTTTLLAGHPALFGPTTGVVIGDELHFIANAQFDLVGPDGSLPPSAELADPVVLGVSTIPR